jgi:hypothetical protein
MLLLVSLLSPLLAQENPKPVLPATVSGSGTTNYIPVWTNSTTLGNSLIYQSGGNVGIGTSSPAYALDVAGHANTSEGYRIQGAIFLANPGEFSTAVGSEALSVTSSSSESNTAVGSEALLANTSGSFNTATGTSALWRNTTGSSNTAIGQISLYDNQTGRYNTAIGANALTSNVDGSFNTATGFLALYTSTANQGGNTADGAEALYYNTTGPYNTAVGYQALFNNTTGGNNIAIGYLAAGNVSPSSNYNIHIGSAGYSTDDGTTRIGTIGAQTSFFAAGIRGVTTGENNAIPVVIDSNGQLGTVSSSRRFKTDIQDMGGASSGLLRLRPVTFRYKKPFADGSQPIQYGLIAEEVAEVYPDLVAYSGDGQPESVKYQVLDAMLLNELQRQQADIHNLQEQIETMKGRFAALAQALEAQRSRNQISQTSARGEEQ